MKTLMEVIFTEELADEVVLFVAPVCVMKLANILNTRYFASENCQIFRFPEPGQVGQGSVHVRIPHSDRYYAHDLILLVLAGELFT